jgi:hypothetical protein
VDDDEENVDHVVVSLGQEPLGVTGERCDPALGRALAEALGLGGGGLGGKAAYPRRRHPIQSEATRASDALCLPEPVEGSDQTLDGGEPGRTSQLFQQGQPRLGLDLEEPLETKAVGVSELGADGTPATPSCTIPDAGYETGQRSDARQQEPCAR